MTEKVRIKSVKYTRKDGSISTYMIRQKYYARDPNKTTSRATFIHPDKLSDEQKQEIYKKWQSGITMTQLAKDYSVCIQTISKAIKKTKALKETNMSPL